MRMNIRQYQQIYNIPTGITSLEYSKEILRIYDMDGDKYSMKEVEDFIHKIKFNDLESLKTLNIKINGKKYGIVKDIMKSSFSEMIEYLNIFKTESEDVIINNLHNILGVFVRPYEKRFLFLKRFKRFNEIDYEQNCKDMLEMDIEDAIKINVFFWNNVTNFINRIKKRSLNQQIVMMRVEKEMKKLKT